AAMSYALYVGFDAADPETRLPIIANLATTNEAPFVTAQVPRGRCRGRNTMRGDNCRATSKARDWRRHNVDGIAAPYTSGVRANVPTAPDAHRHHGDRSLVNRRRGHIGRHGGHSQHGKSRRRQKKPPT